MNKLRIMGSDYVGLFTVCNDTLAFVPKGLDKKEKDLIEKTLDVKVVETKIYESSLLAVFSKMNNKEIILPSYANSTEIENIEKEIKVKIIDTDHALGNLIELNDTSIILSQTLNFEEVKEFSKLKLNLLQTNIAKNDTVGSSLLLTNKSFLINPNASDEEIKLIQDLTKFKGGASTSNTGDILVRNSILANKNGIIVGDRTTGHEMNRIEEALEYNSLK